MSESTLKETLKDRSRQIQVRIVADGQQLGRAARNLIEGEPVRAVVSWADVDAKPKLPQPEPEPYTRRLPLPDAGGRRTRYLRVEEIDWFEAERQYVRVYVRDRKSILVRGQDMTIKSLAARLDPQCFMRVHRSHIVNLKRVEALRVDAPTKRYVELLSGHDVPVSQANWDQLEFALVTGDQV